MAEECGGVWVRLAGTPGEPGGALRNLLERRTGEDEVLGWCEQEGCVLSGPAQGEGSWQTLRPVVPPPFPVERLSCSPCGSRLCLWGSRGVAVVELPARWSKSGLAVLCKSYSVDERFLLSQAEVLRVHWHPGSLSHLLVLASDNTIRVYKVSSKMGPKLVRILKIGPKPSARLAGKRILESLGDTAVDFALAPGSSHLLILRGNGDVYTIDCDLGNDSPIPPKLNGPLTMYPPADDNYGEESCSIMVLGGEQTPALVVIATCSAVLYHCLLLPEPPATEAEQVKRGGGGDGFALYVVEAVELSIALSPDDEDLQYSYAVHLYPIPGNNESYVCVHAAGVHTVTLPLIAQLKEYFLADSDAETEGVLARVAARPSAARYLLCTRAPRAAPLPPAPPAPPVGLCFSAPAPLPALLVLLPDGRTVTRMLEPYKLEETLFKELQMKSQFLDKDELDNMLKERQKVPFSSVIQEILSREVSQPILRTSHKEEPSPKECLELLTQAMVRLRVEYAERQEAAGGALRRKLRGLEAQRAQQLDWFGQVVLEAEGVTAEAMVLREKCALALKKQNDFRERCSRVLRGLRASQVATAAERELIKELEGHKRTCEHSRDQIARLKDTLDLRKRQLKSWKEEYNRKAVCLGRSHSDTISSIINQQSGQLSTIIEEVKLLKDQLSI